MWGGGASQEVLVLKNSPATAGDVRDTGSIPTQKKRHMYRTDFWSLWEKARVGCSERTASKQVYYQG